MKLFADTHVHLESKEPEKTKAMLDLLAELGLTDVSLLAVCPVPAYGITQNLSVLHWKSSYTKLRLRAFGSLHEQDAYADASYVQQVEKLMALGCDGIKFIHMKPDVRKRLGKGLNHPDYDACLSYLEEHRIPVLIHSGDPEMFWDIAQIPPSAITRGWFYGDGTFLSNQAHYDEVFEMLDKHPKLNVVLAHFFFLSNRMDEAARVLDKYPNVRFDLTPGWEMYLGFSKDIDAWQAFFEKYSDRILFGTDSNNIKDFNAAIHELVYTAITHDKTEFQMQCYSNSMVKGLALSPETVEKICYQNYISYVGEAIAPVKKPLLKKEAAQMLKQIENDPTVQDHVVWLRDFLQSGELDAES